MSFFKPPSTIDIQNLTLDDFNIWLKYFENYMICNEHDKKSEDIKIRFFENCGGEHFLKFLNGLDVKEKKLSNYIKAVKDFLQPVKNVILQRHKFFQLVKDFDEDIPAFVSRLRRQADVCEFSDTSIDTVSNLLIRDQLIRGLKNPKMVEHVLSFGELNLNDTIKKAEIYNQAVNDTEIILKHEKPVFNIDKAQNKVITCYSCKKVGHFAKDCRFKVVCSTCQKLGHKSSECFKNKKCSKCKKIGHTENFCKSKPINFIFSILNDGNLKFIAANFCNVKAKFLIDTGAAYSVLSETFVTANNLNRHIKTCKFDIMLADGSSIVIDKCIEGNLNINNEDIFVKFLIMNNHIDGLLGMDILPTLGLKFDNLKGLVCAVVPDILREYKDLFDRGLKDSYLRGIEPIEIIRLEPLAKPRQVTPREVPKKHAKFVQDKINELLNAGVIEESTSSWRHNIIVVGKHDGSSRMTINYKPVNSVTQYDAYPFPEVQNLLNKLPNAKYFSSLDFSQFYHQLPLAKSDMEKTAFCAFGKLYHYVRVPFGLKNAVAYCSRLMAKVFQDIDNVIVYLDDLLVFGETKETHDKTLIKVLNKIREMGLSLNMKKCKFEQTSITFLGYRVENGTIQPDEDRVKPVLEFPRPQSVKALQRFIGMATYYSKFIENFSTLSRPLYEKCEYFNDWSTNDIEAFETIKKKISESLLVLPKDTDLLRLRTDASDDCISAILETEDRRPVYFCSRVLGKHEKHYDIVEKEALAIFWGIIRLKSYLLGREFLVLTDHKPLQFIYNNDKSSPKVLRWKMQLQEFSFRVEHCSGKSNTAADCLSRINMIDKLPGEELITENELNDAQHYDKEVKSMIEAINKNFNRRPDRVSDSLWSLKHKLNVQNGILISNDDRLYVPFSKRFKVLTVAHSNHLGINQTINNIKERFIFPNLVNSVNKFVKNCRICNLVKPKFAQPPSCPILTKAPMEVLAMDFVGPLPPSNGHRYLFVVVDLFSRYPFVYPLKDMKTSRVIDCLKQIFCQVGFPDAVLSDQGSQFESFEFRNFLDTYQIKKLRTNAYHPQGNGCCERLNSTIKKLMKSYVIEKNLSFFSWFLSLNSVLFSYRTTQHSSTGHRPVDLFYGFNVKSYLPKIEVNTENAVSNDFRSKLKNKRYIDKKSNQKQFYVGSQVLVKDINSPKFSLKGKIAEVVEQLDSHSVKLRDTASGFTFRCAISRLAPIGMSEQQGNTDDDVEDWFAQESITWRGRNSVSSYHTPELPKVSPQPQITEGLRTAHCDTPTTEGTEDGRRRSTRARSKPVRLIYHRLGEPSDD